MYESRKTLGMHTGSKGSKPRTQLSIIIRVGTMTFKKAQKIKGSNRGNMLVQVLVKASCSFTLKVLCRDSINSITNVKGSVLQLL